jgi:hypothetical protein
MAGMSPRNKAKKGRFGAYGLAPVIRITSNIFTATNSVAFAASATVTDDEAGDLSASLTWTSNLDGSVGTGDTPSITLTTVGTHVITVAAEEGSPVDQTGSTTFSVVVS